MEKVWWWKTIFVLFLVVVAILYLLPTLVGPANLPQWYSSRIPGKMNLGLDLQGGLHLLYEVEVEKAVSDKADRLADDLVDRASEKKIDVSIERRGLDEIELAFASKEGMDKAKELYEDYPSLEEVSSEGNTIVLAIGQDFEEQTKQFAVDQAIETIERRVDALGVTEPSITKRGATGVVIQLPGLGEKDFLRAKSLIGKTAQLEFKIVDDQANFIETLKAKLPQEIKMQTETYEGKGDALVKVSYLTARKKDTLQAFLKTVEIPKDRQIGFSEVQAQDEKGRPLPEKEWRTWYLNKKTAITGEYITDARVAIAQQENRPYVALNFDRAGAKIFEKLTESNIRNRMAIILDDYVDSAPVIQDRIPEGRAQITLGGFRDYNTLLEEAKNLVVVLRAGALPAPIRKEFETQVGPTLGADSVQKGKYSIMAGSIAVIIFMMIYYRKSGIIANVALLLNIVFILAILAAFEATLTLPGMAGIVLTVGMAVDANVIIFERIREELRLGKTPRSAIDSGYQRARWTIFDANITTIIAGLVLLQYGSGPMRGFAVTLIIGIVTSVFTAVFVSRIIFEYLANRTKLERLSI